MTADLDEYVEDVLKTADLTEYRRRSISSTARCRTGTQAVRLDLRSRRVLSRISNRSESSTQRTTGGARCRSGGSRRSPRLPGGLDVMASPIRVGAVNYLNAKPLYYKLCEIAPDVRLTMDVPSSSGGAACRRRARRGADSLGRIPARRWPWLRDHPGFRDCSSRTGAKCEAFQPGAVESGRAVGA